MASENKKDVVDPEAERIKALADAIDREKIRRAAAEDPGRKLLAGMELYDLARSFMLAGIRMQHPEANEQEVRRLFRQRLEIARKSEEDDRAFVRYLRSLTEGGEAA